MCAKHRRRLRRVWDPSGALAPPDDGLWAAGDPPPRAGCSLDVLIDGAEAFPAIAEAIAGRARLRSTSPAGTSPLTSSSSAATRRSSLRRAARRAAERIDVRVLVWAGAPVPAFHPTRTEVRETVDTLTRRTRIRCEIDPREHPFHCHHEKTIVRRRRARVRRRHRHHRRRRRPLRHQRPPRPASPRLARRRHAAARPGGGRRPRSLRDALARGHRTSIWRGRQPGRPTVDSTVQVVRTVCRGDVRRVPTGRVPDPRELRARPSQRQALHLSRKPVPVVAGDRRASSPTSSATRPATTSGW